MYEPDEVTRHNQTNWRPSPKQAAVLETAMQAGLNRNITAICHAAGVSRAAFYEWLNKDAGFIEVWERVWYRSVRRHLPGAVAALVKQSQSGDVSAIRLMCDLAGITGKKSSVYADADAGPIVVQFLGGQEAK